jgi:cephalosporin hydroxylase
MNEKKFQSRNRRHIIEMAKSNSFKKLTKSWFESSVKFEYSYHFTWLGRPIIQYPQDIMALQEIIWKVKPDLIIETGIARGGSLMFSASILQLLGKGKVLGIDIKIRPENKKKIQQHFLWKRISMIEGSSIDKKTIDKVYKFAKGKKRVMVVLDSNHTHEHVLNELKAYSPLVSKNSYLVVFDTIIEDLPKKIESKQPWSKGNNPKTALLEFLKHNKQFKIDKEIENKLMISVAPSGYLQKIK